MASIHGKETRREIREQVQRCQDRVIGIMGLLVGLSKEEKMAVLKIALLKVAEN